MRGTGYGLIGDIGIGIVGAEAFFSSLPTLQRLFEQMSHPASKTVEARDEHVTFSDIVSAVAS